MWKDLGKEEREEILKKIAAIAKENDSGNLISRIYYKGEKIYEEK